MGRHKDYLGMEMKEKFENVSKTYLEKKVPVIGRLDGRSFGKFTKQFEQPFDDTFINMMNQTAVELCKEIQGAKMAYVQSDEISVLITDTDTEETDAWFGYGVQKMCSVGSAIASNAFNAQQIKSLLSERDADMLDVIAQLQEGIKMAQFDARFFSVADRFDVNRYFMWRQQDAIRNSVSMCAQNIYSAKELHGVSREEMIQKMIEDHDYDWRTDLDHGKQYGRTIVKQKSWKPTEYPVKQKQIDAGTARKTDQGNEVLRSEWVILDETPLFGETPNFVLKLV